MIEETKFNRALARTLTFCGIGVFYLAVGESLLHQFYDIIGWNVHPIQNTGRMNGLIAIITVIVGGQRGGQWLDYKRQRDCVFPQEQFDALKQNQPIEQS